MIDFLGRACWITSEGSLRIEDLSQGLLDFCLGMDIHEDWVRVLEAAISLDESDEKMDVDERAETLLNAYENAVENVELLLPDGWWYGSSEGDGALIGFWKTETEEED